MRIHSFESLAARDGDGLRYAVFLAGCPLRCVYCHNPDTWTHERAQEYTIEQIAKKILRCKPYMLAGHGGVTFSGGEPLLQSDELYRLICLLKQEGIGSCIDTSGNVPLTQKVKDVLEASESVLLDLKFPTEEAYYQHTKGKLFLVTEMLSYLTQNNIPTRIRTVIVPQLNDSTEALLAYARVLMPFKDGISQWELLPFHTLGFEKYELLGIENPLLNTPALPDEKRLELQVFANSLLQK